MRRLIILLSLVYSMVPLQCATLERLSLADMIVQSTSIVRGKVVSSSVSSSGRVVYTHYRVQVVEQLKGNAAGSVDVAVPGGTLNGTQYLVSGAPQFQAGDEYVFFLWTSKTGLTQVIGLTQGVFSLSGDGTANPAVIRAASQELMFDRATHQPVKDQTLNMRLAELRSQITKTLGAGN